MVEKTLHTKLCAKIKNEIKKDFILFVGISSESFYSTVDKYRDLKLINWELLKNIFRDLHT